MRLRGKAESLVRVSVEQVGLLRRVVSGQSRRKGTKLREQSSDGNDASDHVYLFIGFARNSIEWDVL